MDENFLLQEKVSKTSLLKKTVILEKRIRQFSLKLNHYEVCLGFFNPWKSTFPSSSLELFFLFILSKDRFSYLYEKPVERKILLNSSQQIFEHKLP